MHSLREFADIEKTMVTLDNVLGYYHVAKDVEEFIKEGYKYHFELFCVCMGFSFQN